jgi:phosphoribosyl-ATP pyrophosphohydrolase
MERVIETLYQVILSRRENPVEGSYTAYLLEQGIDKILKKVGEECAEVIIASKNANKKEAVYEISDLIYHLLVLMADMDIKPEEIYAELSARAQKQGNLKESKSVDRNT